MRAGLIRGVFQQIIFFFDEIFQEELYKSGIKAGDQINCSGTSSQKFWRRHNLLLRYFCCDCDKSFSLADAKKDHMDNRHGNHVVCSTCCQVTPKGGSAHVITVIFSFIFLICFG